jgi:hypothetical protein
VQRSLTFLVYHLLEVKAFGRWALAIGFERFLE